MLAVGDESITFSPRAASGVGIPGKKRWPGFLLGGLLAAPASLTTDYRPTGAVADCASAVAVPPDRARLEGRG